MRGKATPDHVDDLLAIIDDVLTDARLDNRERIQQMVLESKAGFESSLAGSGNGIVSMRLRAGFSEADWLNETAGRRQPLFLPQATWSTEIDSELAQGAGGARGDPRRC